MSASAGAPPPSLHRAAAGVWASCLRLLDFRGRGRPCCPHFEASPPLWVTFSADLVLHGADTSNSSACVCVCGGVGCLRSCYGNCRPRFMADSRLYSINGSSPVNSFMYSWRKAEASAPAQMLRDSRSIFYLFGAVITDNLAAGCSCRRVRMGEPELQVPSGSGPATQTRFCWVSRGTAGASAAATGRGKKVPACGRSSSQTRLHWGLCLSCAAFLDMMDGGLRGYK